MNDLTRPISNRSLFGLTKVILSKKRGCFRGCNVQNDCSVHKNGRFHGQGLKLMVLSMKRDVFMDERIAQKRDTLERISP